MALNEKVRAHLDGCIRRLRGKLIDITKRNPLISFKHSERGAAYVRVVDENPDILFDKLRAGAEASASAEGGEETTPSPPPRSPGGRKRTVDGIDFYEPMTGYYEVYAGNRMVGEIERINDGLAPTHFKSRPQYRASMCDSGDAFNTTDIYEAVREVTRRAACAAAE